MQIKEIPHFNWKALDKVLSRLRDAINTNEPVEGAGIRVIEHPGAGRLIESNPGTGGSGAKGGTVWHGVKWQNVDVIDADCNRSTINVLVNTGKDTDTVTIS